MGFDWKNIGPAMWRELHSHLDADAAWLVGFTARIPCGECKTHWQALLRTMPPVFADGWYDWTVAAHNAVNARLGKPLWEGTEARRHEGTKGEDAAAPQPDLSPAGMAVSAGTPAATPRVALPAGWKPVRAALNRPSSKRWKECPLHAEWRRRQIEMGQAFWRGQVAVAKAVGADVRSQKSEVSSQKPVRLGERKPAPADGAAIGVVEDLRHFFGHVLVISLKRTPERLAAFWDRFPLTWPFERPEVFEAIDGAAERPKRGWWATPGAWGCYRSWVGILDRAIGEKWDKPILVMEDDCQWIDGSVDAAGRVRGVLEDLPANWQILFFGCQHMLKPRTLTENIARVMGAERTHAMAIHPSYFVELREQWENYSGHVDHRLREIASRQRFYAASPVLAIQAENKSQIVNVAEPPRAWDPMVNAGHACYRFVRDKTLVIAPAFYGAMPREVTQMIDSAKQVGIDVHLIGKRRRFSNLFQDKISGLYDAVKNADGYQRVMMVDASDLVFLAGLHEIEEKFAALKSPIVMSAETAFFPNWQQYAHLFPASLGRFRYLNSGGIVAEREAYREVLEFLIARSAADPGFEKQMWHNDQPAMLYAYATGKFSIKLDTRCSIFQCFYGTGEGDFRWGIDGKRIVNNETGERPCVAHTNGSCKHFLPKLYSAIGI